MRTIGAALAILWGSIAVGASAQQAPPTSTTSPRKEPRYDTGTLPRPAPGTTLRGSVVFVYSFLDTRLDAIGVRGIDRFQDALVQAFNGAQVQAKMLPFRGSASSMVGHSLPTETTNPIPQFPLVRETRRAVPVMETVAESRADEEAAGAKYRLVLFPAYSSEMGYTKSIDVNWTLTDIQTGKVIWVFSTTTWYSELIKAKLVGTIDNAMASLRKTGLIQ